LISYHLLSHFGQEVFQDLIISLHQEKAEIFYGFIVKLLNLQDQLIVCSPAIPKFESQGEKKRETNLTCKL